MGADSRSLALAGSSSVSSGLKWVAGLLLHVFYDSQVVLVVKNLPARA